MLPLVIFSLNVKLLNSWILNIIKGCFSVAHKSKGQIKTLSDVSDMRPDHRMEGTNLLHCLAVLCKIAMHRGLGLFTLVLC